LFSLLRLWHSFVSNAQRPLENTIEPFACVVTKAIKSTWTGNTSLVTQSCGDCLEGLKLHFEVL